jgi:hypothetical protein
MACAGNFNVILFVLHSPYLIPYNSLMTKTNDSDNDNTETQRFFAGLFTLLALGVLGAGLYLGIQSWRLEETGQLATGTVVGFKEKEDDETRDISYAPIVQFQVDGETFRFTGTVYTTAPSTAIGTTVPILYNMDNPNIANINDRFALWQWPFGLTIAGLFVFISSIGMWRRAKQPIGSASANKDT